MDYSPKVLVAGGSGFVGLHLVKRLKELDMWTDEIPDLIVNLAAKSDVEESIANPYSTVLNNVGCALDALEEARELGVPIIQFSTVEVQNISNPYAASKAAQDAAVQAYSLTYGFPAVITTTNNIVGVGQKGKFIPTLIEQIKAGEEVSIYMDQGAMGYRIYNPVQNVVAGLIFIIQRPIEGLTRYHLSGGQELSNLEMAQKIADLLDKPLKYKLVEASTVRPGYTRHLTSGGIRLEDLGWQPPITLAEGLEWISSL